MEDLQVPAIFYGRDATLACYACGRTSGTVVDIGYSGITVTPVYEGYVETKGIRRLPVGTQKIDETIAKTLDTLHGTAFLPLYQVQKFKQRQESIHYLARLAVAQQCREEGSGAAVLAVSDVCFTAPSMSFELPDGTLVDIPAKKRFGAADTILGQEEDSLALREETFSETLTKLKTLISQASENQEMQDDADKEHFDQVFSEASSVGLLKRRQEAKKNKSSKKPDSSGKSFSHTWKYLQKACLSSLQSQQDLLTTSSIPHMVCDSAFRCDRDQQASLLGNVVVAGGGACLGPTDQALPDYLREQVEAIIHQHTPGWRVKVLSPNLQERSICSWLGGSILGSLGTFHEMWITKKEYDEWGSAIVNRKCP
jgi:actin-related protein